MKPSTKKILLNLYFYFQCLVNILNFICLLWGLFMVFILWGLSHDYPPTMMEEIIITTVAITIAVIMIFLFCICILSSISTKNILQGKPLTKLKKFSVVIFPIITVPFYSCLIYLLLIIMPSFAKYIPS